MNTKICKGCKKELPFNDFSPNKILKDGRENKCRNCRQKQRNKNHKHVCNQCDKNFTSAKKDTKYCSRKCSSLGRRNRVEIKCLYCKQTFEEKEALKDTAKFCDIDCKAKWQSENMIGENNFNYNRVTINCSGCGDKIARPPSEIENHKLFFCTNECYKKNIGKYVSGENNPYYNPNLTDEDRLDTRRYPEYYEWRLKVYERDNYTCQLCGGNKSGTLIAHHLNGYSHFSDERTVLENGITLCKECHAEFHTEYGYGYNTKEQFKEYYSKYANHERSLLETTGTCND